MLGDRWIVTTLWQTIMSASVSNGETYPGCNYSLSQLLSAAKRKLQETQFGGRCVQYGFDVSTSDIKNTRRVTSTVNQVEVRQSGILLSIRAW